MIVLYVIPHIFPVAKLKIIVYKLCFIVVYNKHRTIYSRDTRINWMFLEKDKIEITDDNATVLSLQHHGMGNIYWGMTVWIYKPPWSGHSYIKKNRSALCLWNAAFRGNCSKWGVLGPSYFYLVGSQSQDLKGPGELSEKTSRQGQLAWRTW